jgi:hypothetical protein
VKGSLLLGERGGSRSRELGEVAGLSAQGFIASENLGREWRAHGDGVTSAPTPFTWLKGNGREAPLYGPRRD